MDTGGIFIEYICTRVAHLISCSSEKMKQIVRTILNTCADHCLVVPSSETYESSGHASPRQWRTSAGVRSGSVCGLWWPGSHLEPLSKCEGPGLGALPSGPPSHTRSGRFRLVGSSGRGPPCSARTQPEGCCPWSHQTGTRKPGPPSLSRSLARCVLTAVPSASLC